jgi:hypothetical protein
VKLINHQSNVDAETKAKALIAQAQSAYILAPTGARTFRKRIFPLAVQDEMPERAWFTEKDTPRVAASPLYFQACTDNDQVPMDFMEKVPDDKFPDTYHRNVDKSQIVLFSHASSPLSVPTYLKLIQHQCQNDPCLLPDLNAVLSVITHFVKLALPSSMMIGPFISSPHCQYTIENCASSRSPVLLEGSHSGGLLVAEPRFFVVINPGERFCLEDVPFTFSLIPLDEQSDKKPGKRKRKRDRPVCVNCTILGFSIAMESDQFVQWVKDSQDMDPCTSTEPR